MLPRIDVPIGPTGGNRKQESLEKSARHRTKLPRSELYPSENLTGLTLRAPAPKQRSNLPSALASKPLSERVLRPISVNISTPISLSSPSKTVVRRFRSGSEGKIKSLQPDDDQASVSPQQSPSDSCKPSIQIRTDYSAEIPSAPTETSQLSSKNLQTLSNMLRSNQPPHAELSIPEDSERDSLKPGEEGISEKYFSLAPTLGSSQRSHGSAHGDFTCSEGSPPTEPLALRSTFFNVGIILPAPPCEVGRPDKAYVENAERSSESRLASMRLETMILKQRRVDFEPVESESKLGRSVENDRPLTDNHLGDSNLDHQSSILPTRNSSTIGKVRCALLESERLLGIKWINNVDTTLTTNPHITPEVRYHASLLFSLYWGSRSPKVSKPDVVPISQAKTTRDLSAEREAKKKLKLIAATAMACLTLTIKARLMFFLLRRIPATRFTQNADVVTPEDLIIAERAILFSYPVAGGLWLDSPHAFLEELIHIIPSLRLLSNVPSYLFSEREKKDSKSSHSGLSESKKGQEPKNGVRWDWPKVVHHFERTLAKATMWQEVLAFEPSVLCVVALYIALDGVEAGYHEKNEDKILLSNPVFPINEASTHSDDRGLCLESRLFPKGREPVGMPSADLNDTEGPWIWRWVDINDTMDQVCRTTQVSGLRVIRTAQTTPHLTGI
ncbi:hypothetical protein PGT21_003792 [Puccinia graminis f. sp. tritici]|uniref:Uncharacterized protein n=1 Tax=Puccinia graminis f. sp. tritici TaxID=56615 RepID=A0A5B0PK18_PUCGR|nr:hypothetical protein PGT21_003792 [Puccinia graminis f. sp. tritici]